MVCNIAIINYEILKLEENFALWTMNQLVTFKAEEIRKMLPSSGFPHVEM